MLLKSYTKPLRSQRYAKMPFRARKSRKSYRRRSQLRRRPRLNINKAIKKYLDSQAETKTMDTTAVLSVSDAGSATVQPLPIKGTNSYNRIADEINLVSHFIRVQMYFPAVSPDTNNRIRFMFICDRVNRGTTPVLADVLQDMAHPMTTPLNKSFAGRFVVIIDKFITIRTPNNPTTTKKFYIKTKKFSRQDFITNTGTITDIRTFCYFIITVSDSNAIGHPNLEYYWRLNFKDC